MADDADYELPPRLERANGEIRRVGFELEFSGIDLETAVAAIRSGREATVISETAAEVTLEAGELGTFTIEIDWTFLKRVAADGGEPERRDWVRTRNRPGLLPTKRVRVDATSDLFRIVGRERIRVNSLHHQK